MRLLACLLFVLPFVLFSQDVVIKRDGKEIKTRVIKIDKKTISYKDVSDPEFNTVTVDKKDVKMIRMEDGSVIDFDRIFSKPYVGISSGMFLPTAAFASSDPNRDNTGGYAKPGINFNFNAGFYLGKHIGIPIEFQFHSSKLDVKKYNEQLASGSTSVSISSTMDSYKFYSLRTGLMYSGMIGKKFNYDLKALVGMLVLNERNNTDVYNDSFTGAQILRKSTTFKTAFSPAGGGGINLRYLLGERFAVGIYTDFIISTPDVKYDRFVEDFVNLGNGSSDKNLNLTRSISGLKTGISFYYQFNRRKNQ